MKDYCAFSNNHRCIKWSDYEIALESLEEADELCHQNWIELEHLHAYINILKNILDDNNIEYPNIFDVDFEK